MSVRMKKVIVFSVLNASLHEPLHSSLLCLERGSDSWVRTRSCGYSSYASLEFLFQTPHFKSLFLHIMVLASFFFILLPPSNK